MGSKVIKHKEFSNVFSAKLAQKMLIKQIL